MKLKEHSTSNRGTFQQIRRDASSIPEMLTPFERESLRRKTKDDSNSLRKIFEKTIRKI